MEKQFVVLGLGIFGSTLVKTLSQYGREVIAIDKNPENVQRVADFATKAVIGDVTDFQFLSDLGLDDMDVGIVAIGDRLEDSILATMNLKELGVPYVIVKAKNKRFKVVLEKIGADYVVRPEKEMGEKVARTLLRKNIKDLIELDHFISTLSNVYRVEILPYHTLGVFKWEELNIPYQLEGIKPPVKERVENAKRLLHVDRYTCYLDN